MANLNIELPDPMKEFVDRKIGPGRCKDASAYVQLLVAEAMECEELEFSDEQKERIDQLLLESLESHARGEYVPVRPGEFEELAKRIVAQRHEPDCYIKDGKIVFANDEQRERLEMKLEEALDEIERGDVVPYKSGDCARMAREYLKQRKARDANYKE